MRSPIPEPDLKSTQRELNPHIRHGKATGFRYIMGAQATRVGFEPNLASVKD